MFKAVCITLTHTKKKKAVCITVWDWDEWLHHRAKDRIQITKTDDLLKKDYEGKLLRTFEFRASLGLIAHGSAVKDMRSISIAAAETKHVRLKHSDLGMHGCILCLFLQ